jgi:hypothetical protein
MVLRESSQMRANSALKGAKRASFSLPAMADYQRWPIMRHALRGLAEVAHATTVGVTSRGVVEK